MLMDLKNADRGGLCGLPNEPFLPARRTVKLKIFVLNPWAVNSSHSALECVLLPVPLSEKKSIRTGLFVSWVIVG